MALYFTGDLLLEWTWRCAELTASRYILRSDAVPRAATARYVSVVLVRLTGCLRRLPDSTRLSTTPRPTGVLAICMMTLAGPASRAAM